MKEAKIGEVQVGDSTVELFGFKFTDEERERIYKLFNKWTPSIKEMTAGDVARFEEEEIVRRILADDPKLLHECLEAAKPKPLPEMRKQLLNEFILDMEGHLDFFLKWMKDAPNMSTYIKDTKDLIDNLRETKRHLKNLILLKALKAGTARFTKIDEVIPSLDSVKRTNFLIVTASTGGIVKFAREAEKPIEQLLKILNYNYSIMMKRPKKTGKPSIDSNSGLVDEIAKSFQSCLKTTPTAYSSSKEDSRGGLFFKVITTIFEILEIEAEDPSRLIKSAIKKLSIQ